MRLLFDENLSPHLCRLLADVYPGSESILLSGLGGKPDTEVWRHASERGMIVVGKDSDFIERAMVSSGRRNSSGYASGTAPHRPPTRRFERIPKPFGSSTARRTS